MACVVYTAVKRCDPESRADWARFVAWSGLTHLREVVSLDAVLCPTAFRELTTDDWEHNVQEDFHTSLFRDLDHVSARVLGKAAHILALIEEPTEADVASFCDARFEFCGFDLVDENGSTSALTNCGGFDKAFEREALSPRGLLTDYATAVAVRQLLRTEYPDEPHARCRVWAIWTMKR